MVVIYLTVTVLTILAIVSLAKEKKAKEGPYLREASEMTRMEEDRLVQLLFSHHFWLQHGASNPKDFNRRLSEIQIRKVREEFNKFYLDHAPEVLRKQESVPIPTTVDFEDWFQKNYGDLQSRCRRTR